MEQLPPELVGRAIQDSEFRRRLLADPDVVVAAEGYDLTDAQLEALRNLDAAAVDQAIDAMLGDLATSKWG
jgi:Ribosomally synthesized peptide prototyped by Frankia Franean1_4349.